MGNASKIASIVSAILKYLLMSDSNKKVAKFGFRLASKAIFNGLVP